MDLLDLLGGIGDPSPVMSSNESNNINSSSLNSILDGFGGLDTTKSPVMGGGGGLLDNNASLFGGGAAAAMPGMMSSVGFMNNNSHNSSILGGGLLDDLTSMGGAASVEPEGEVRRDLFGEIVWIKFNFLFNF